MKSNLRKALALLLTLIMVMTSLPTSALAEMFAEASQSIQPFAGAKLRSVIKPDDEDVYVTFTFKNEGTVVDTQIINTTKSETLKEPATPSVPEGKRFDGWYVDNNTKLDFDKFDPSAYTGEVTVDAKFTNVYYVYFLDKEEKYVYYTAEVTGDTVTVGDMAAANQYEFKDSKLQGWVIRDTSTPFTEATPVTGDTYVTPVTIPAYWITFNTDGGMGVPSQYVAQGKSIDLSTVDEPTKLGYAFAGWKNEAGEDVTNTTITPEKSMTLKAQWTASQVKYTVVYWGENADDTNYSVLATDANKTALTGTKHTLTASTGALPTGVENRQHFTFEKSDTVTIAADGSSVLNVYYKRNTYTLTFREGGGWSGYNTVATITAKYNAKISGEFSKAPFNTTYNGRAWKCTDSDKYSYALQTLDRMPGFDATFNLYQQSSYTLKTIYYYVQKVGTTVSSSSWPTSTANFDLLKQVDTYFNYATYDEEYHEIQGFTRYAARTAGFRNNRKDFSGNALSLYYLRDKYNLILNNYGVEDTHTVEYEAPLAQYNKTPARPEGFSENAEFKGWYTVDPSQVTEGIEPFDFENQTMPVGGMVLYALWKEPQIKVTIEISVTVGAGFNESNKLAAGSTIADSAVYAKAVAYIATHNLVLLKWVDAEGNLVDINQPLYADKTIHPVFSGTTYELKYDLGTGATGAAPVDGKEYGPDSLARVMGTDATLNGQPFAYWTNAADAAGTRYYPGAYIKMTANTTLTAHYAPLQEKVSVTYHANYPGSNPESVEQHQNTLNNGTITVLSYEVTGLKNYVGYTFKGWATTAEGDVAFAAGASARVNNQETNDLYAVWTPSTDTKYTVQYYWQNVNDDAFTLHEEDELSGTTGATATADEKTYTGLTLDKTIDGTLLSGTIAADGSLVLKLYYIRNTYTVTFNRGANGHLAGEDANGNVTTANLRYGADTPTAPAVTPDAGYTFSDVWNPAIAPTVTGDATYTAQYAEDGNVTILYTVDPTNGGRVSSANESLAPATGRANGSTATAKPGWRFTGWTLANSATVLTTENALTPAKGDDNGSAIWTERTYVAHFERTTAELTVEKQWLGDEGYTDNRVPVTLTIGRRAGSVEDKTFTETVSLTTTVLSKTLQVETHHENGTPYTYYIKEEKATNAADQTKLDTYYSSDPTDTANLTTDDKTLTAKNTLATKELTIAKAINPELPNAYKSERFAFAVAKDGDSTPVLLMKKNADNSVEPIDKIELTNAESITLILPIGTYTVSEVLTDAQKEVWQAQPSQRVTLPDQQRVVFTNTVKTGEITVNKVWVDEKSAHSDVTVSVTGTNDFHDMQTFASSKTFTVPLRNVDGTEATYAVVETDYGREGSTGEVDDSGFYQTFYKVEGGSMSADASAVPANKTVTVYNVEMGNVQIQKRWDNYSAEDIAKLYDVEGQLTYTVLGIDETVGFSIPADGNWKTAKRVPLYTLVNGEVKEIVFAVAETGVYLKNEDGGRGDSIMDSFTPSYDQDSLTITNTYTADDGYRAISVNKKWVRPAYMTTDDRVAAEFTLYRYTGTGNAQAELNNAAKWTKVVDTITLPEPATGWAAVGDNKEASNSDTFARVPRYDASGAEIVYAVKEAGELGDYTPDKTAEVVGSENAVRFRNVMNETEDALILTKHAYDVDGTELHAGTFTFKIWRGDARAKIVTIDLKNGDRTSVSLVPGTYTVAEIGAAAWTTSYTVTGTTEKIGDGQTAEVATGSIVAFENRRISADAFRVTKYWVGENAAINVRPNTTDYAKWLTFYQKKGESGAWEPYAATPTIGEAGSSTYTITYTGMPKAAADGTPFTYAVKETPSSYYTLTATTNRATGLDNAVLSGGSMTNTLNSGSLTITKNLVDESGETYSADFTFTVKLDGVDGSVTKKVTADSEAKTGTATVSNLPVGSYTVTEATVHGWTATSDPAGGKVTVVKDGTAQVTFTNTRQLYAQVTVLKQWFDGDGELLAEKHQPDTLPIVVQRSTDFATSANLVEVSETLKKADGWTLTLENMPLYTAAGEVYQYNVTEQLPEGFGRLGFFTNLEGDEPTLRLTNAKLDEEPTVPPTKTVDEANSVMVKDDTTGGVAMAQVGEKLTYTIGYRNHLSTAQTITVTDTLPAGLEPAEDSAWSWNAESRTASIQIQNAAPFEEGSVTLTVVVTADALNGDSNPTVSNTATVTIGGANYSSNTEETPVYNPDFSVTKRLVGNPNHAYAEGETVEFMITVSNTGNVLLKNVTVTDVLRNQNALLNEQGEPVGTLTIDSLAVGASREFSAKYVVEYDDLGGQFIYNSATAKYDDTPRSDTVSFRTDDFTHFTVAKVWEDNGNKLGVRPDSVTVALTRNGEVYRTEELKAVDGWSYTFYRLPTKDPIGTPFQYSVVETKIGNLEVNADMADYRVDVDAEDKAATITNTLDVSANTVSIEKVWNDDNNSYGLRPKAEDFASWVQLQREENGSWVEYTGTENYPVTKAITSDYKVTFSGMPKYAPDGNEYEYRIVEVNEPEYYTAEAGEKLVNSLLTATLTVKKTLTDESYGAPATQTFRFYVARTDGREIKSFGDGAELKSDAAGKYFEITVAKGATEAKTLTLPEGEYTITEATSDAWTTTVNGATGAAATVVVPMAGDSQEVSFANTRNLYNNDGEIAVTKVWERIGDEEYPNVTFRLMQQLGTAEATEYKTLTLLGTDVRNGTVSGAFTQVPAFAPDGTAYVYSVTENDVGGYQQAENSPSVNDAKTAWTFTNVQIPADAIQITKKWVDLSDQFRLRPHADEQFNSYVTLARSTDGKNWSLFDWDKSVRDNKDNTYSVVFSGMPQTDDSGKTYQYRAVEYKTPDEYYVASGEGYMAIVGSEQAMYAYAGNLGTLTNTLQTGTITIAKQVEGYVGDAFEDGADEAELTFRFNIRRDMNDNVDISSAANPTITVKLTKNPDGTVNAASEPAVIVLPTGMYEVSEINNGAWAVSVRHDDPQVEPTVVPTDGSQTSNSSATLHTGNTVTFTNTRRMFNGDGEYTVTKYWNRYDENEAFPNVTIELSDGARTRSVELKSEDVQVDGQNANLGSVSHTFDSLPANDLDGTPLTYTAEESDVNGYTAQPPLSTDTSTAFTNTADAFALTVYKKWVDGDGNAYTGALPASVTVKLWRRIAGGEETLYKTATLDGQSVDESGRWYDAASFGGPTHDAEGRPYEYFVTEDTVEGFTPEKSRLTMADFAKETDASNLYSAELVNRKVEDGEKQPEKTVFADFKTVQITDETTGKMVEDGDELTYTIGYYNHLSVPATVVVTDALNENLAFDPADNPGAEYDADTHTVTWTIEGVKPCSGGSVELKVKVMLTDDALASEDPTISNTAGVQIGNRPVQTAASEDVTVYHPRLKVDKITANVPAKGYYALGETAEFEITASNTGNVLLENIVITERLEGAQFVQSDDYTVEDGKAIIAALNPGQSVVVRAQYTVKLDDLYAEDDQQQAPMKNIVTATAQSGDDPVDGGDESEFKPDQLTHLTVEKHWVDDLAVQRGDVRVQLTADGESYTADSRYDHEVIISSEDKDVWVMEFDNLPKHNADGSEIRYSAVETHVDGHGTVTDGRCDGYDVTVADDPDAHTTVITNTAQRKKFTVHKVWKDGEGDLAESLIPDTELTVALFVDGFDMNDDDFRTTLTRANGWTGEIDGMFAYNQAGVAYEYTPMEMDANGNAIADGGSIVIDGVTYDVSITTQTEPDANRAEAHRDVTVTVTNTRRSDDPEENKPTKEANLAPGKTTVSVGDSLTYTISYHNSRNVKADVTITDVLAESLNFGSASHGGTYDPDTRTVTWVLRDVAAFASDAVTLTVTVNEKAKQADDAATVKNTATVVIPGNEPDIRTNTVEIPVEPEEGVKPTKKAVGIDPAKDTVEIGQKVEYRIGYRNHKNTAVSVRIVDKLDDGVKFISASDGGVYDAAKHTVIWNIAKLAPFADGEVTLTVEVTEAARKLANDETMATVKNTATVKFDNDAETETNVVDIPVKPNDPKKPEKKAEGLNATDTKKVGDEIVYTITYVNNLNKKAKVVVTDALDEGVDFVEADNGGVYDKASHTVTWTFASVDPFEGDAVKLTVKVNEKARQIKEGEITATVDNTAAVTVDNKTTTTSDPVEIPVTPDKPTDPTKKADDKALNSFGKIAVGDQLPFTVSYVNNLNTVATVTVRDTLEEGLTFVSADNGGTYDEATRTVTWVLKDVAPFTSGSVTVITEVNENAVDAADPTVANSAVVKLGDQPEQTTEPAEVTVYNPAFSVEKKLTNLPAKGYFTAGETAAFDITVKNTGNVPLENVAVEELLDGVTFVQGEGYTIDGRIATIAALPIGEQIVLKAEYTVIEADLGNTDLANRITVRGEVPENPDDPDQPHNPEDKGDEEPIPVDECVEITGTKTWNDADNAYGARPDVILVMLLANGEEKIGTRASAETEWKYTFIQQPKHDADGNEVVYSIREEEVPGYDTTYSAEGYDITNTLRRHTLTIRYWIDEVGGEQAFKTFTRDYYYGERYNVVSPAMDGYRADPEVVSGRIEGDLEVDVVYTAILWRLNIRYRRVGDGKTLAPMYTNGNVIIGDAYEVESPVIPGYTADRLVVKGEMHGRNMSFTVWYTPEQTEVVIVDEKTPFGLGNVVMNAGDCFE